MTYDPTLSYAMNAALEAVRNMKPDEAANDNQGDQESTSSVRSFPIAHNIEQKDQQP